MIVATIVIVLLCVCVYRTFSSQRNAKLHKKIKEKMANTERGGLTKADEGDDSAFEKLQTLDVKKQYKPGAEENFFNDVLPSQKRKSNMTPTPGPEYPDEEDPHEQSSSSAADDRSMTRL